MSMSPSMEIALSAAIGVIPIGLAVLFRRLKERQEPELRDLALALPAATFIGVSSYGWIHEGRLPLGARLVGGGAGLLFCVAGLAASVRMLLANWHDEDELADQFGLDQGYIPRRRTIPIRFEALLCVLLFAALLLAQILFYSHSLFAPE